MKTRVCRLYAQGDIRVETDEVAAPGPGQVLLRIGAGGICGSDLHYYQDGGFGPIRVREPIILGHEAAGTVEALGDGRRRLCARRPRRAEPQPALRRVQLLPRGTASSTASNMRFNGSAMRMPHEQGAFRDLMVVEAAQCVPVRRKARACRRPPAPSRWPSACTPATAPATSRASACW